MKRLLGLVLAVVLVAGVNTPSGPAGASTDPNGWLPVPWVRYALNPTFTAGPDNPGDAVTDRVFPTWLRVDTKIPNALDRFYLWVWRHGGPYDAEHGGRLRLYTAPKLDTNWTDRGWVTPVDGSAPDWGPWSNTGGDVVWSPKYSKFFTVPHSHHKTTPGLLSTFLWESADGVNWSRTSDTPILSAGPEWYDKKETGYGKLMIDPASPPGTEKWIWFYRSGYACGTCPNNEEFYTFSVARADDIHGPWVKDANNPAYTPLANGGLIGVNGFAYYEGKFQIIWQDTFGDTYMSRSSNLHTWEDFSSNGSNRTPIFTSGGGYNEAIITGGDFHWDNIAAQWSYVYVGFTPEQLVPEAQRNPAVPGKVTINLARGVGGHP
jgi:hypothetical protein